MCNHFHAKPEQIADWAVWSGARPTTPINADVWPKRIATVARIENTQIMPDNMHWGVPLNTTGKSGKPVTKYITNVRNLVSPFWKSTLAQPAQRCLVPFTAFAEPKPGIDHETGGPAEYWFSIADGSVGAMAGIWRHYDGVGVFAFLTCKPNPLVAPLHPKAMPVILQPEDYQLWLRCDYADACALAVPFPSQLMRLEGWRAS